jgi:hypothetical protein
VHLGHVTVMYQDRVCGQERYFGSSKVMSRLQTRNVQLQDVAYEEMLKQERMAYEGTSNYAVESDPGNITSSDDESDKFDYLLPDIKREIHELQESSGELVVNKNAKAIEMDRSSIEKRTSYARGLTAEQMFVRKRNQNKLSSKRYRVKKKGEAVLARDVYPRVVIEFQEKMEQLRILFAKKARLLGLVHERYQTKTNPKYVIHFPKWYKPEVEAE